MYSVLVSQEPGSKPLTVDSKNARALHVHVQPYFDRAVHHVYSNVHVNQRNCDGLTVGALDSAGVFHLD